MKKIAVILSGCGHQDGSEITESVSTLIALSEAGVEWKCFAPNIEIDSVSHLVNLEGTHKSTGPRNVLTESARIARGEIEDLKTLKETDFDAVIFPGGFGAALNLSNWAKVGAAAKVLPDVERVIREFHKASKPIGAICIAPALIAKVLGTEGVNLTIGTDAATITEISKTGSQHVKCGVTDYASDRDHKVLSTPAYMDSEAKPHEVFIGIRNMIRELVEMA